MSLFYRNDTESDDLLPLSLDSCVIPTLCTLEEFTKLAIAECDELSPHGMGSIFLRVVVVSSVMRFISLNHSGRVQALVSIRAL